MNDSLPVDDFGFHDQPDWITVNNITSPLNGGQGSYIYIHKHTLKELEWATTYELTVEAKNEFGWNRPNEPFRFKVLSGMTHLLLLYHSFP